MQARVLFGLLALSASTLVARSFAADEADAAAGKTYFARTCTQCHTAEPDDGGGQLGPKLVGLFGRVAAAGDPAFAYSPALKESKLVWNAETLERFLADPMAAVPGTLMAVPVAAKHDRDNLVAYFRSLTGTAK
jgi:cytochrome c